MGMLYLIRHGQASFGEANYDRLSPRGEKQAELLADYLIQTDTRFDLLASGSLSRQEKTARILMEKLKSRVQSPKLSLLPAFNEYDSEGVFREMLPAILAENKEASRDLENMVADKQAFQKILGQVLDRWMDMETASLPLESWSEFRSRVHRGILDLDLKGPKKTAIVTSGGVMAACLHLFLQVPPKKAITMSWQCFNTSLSIWVAGKGENFRLHAWNLAPHLELCHKPDLITYR
jgi:broad specificity phosphatase PhoE